MSRLIRSPPPLDITTGHLAILNCVGTPIRLVPDRSLARVCDWFPTVVGNKGGATPAVRAADRRSKSKLEDARPSTSPYLVPVFSAARGGSSSRSMASTGAAAGLVFSLDLDATGRRIAVGNGTRVVELLLPPVLGVPCVPPELTLDTSAPNTWRGKDGTAMPLAGYASSTSVGAGKAADAGASPNRAGGARSGLSQPSGEGRSPAATRRWGLVKRQAAAASVAAALGRGGQQAGVDPQMWALRQSRHAPLAMAMRDERRGGRTSGVEVRPLPMLLRAVPQLAVVRVGAVSHHAPCSMCTRATMQMRTRAREALLAAVAAMAGVLVGAARDVDGVAALPDDGDGLASDMMQAYQPGALPHRALAAWALIHAPDAPWGGLAAHVRAATSPRGHPCRAARPTHRPAVRDALPCRATLSLPPTWRCSSWPKWMGSRTCGPACPTGHSRLWLPR